MATVLNNYKYLTLVELAKRTDPRGGAAVIAEILHRTNEIVQDMVWLEANDTFSHKTTRRMSLPEGQWRKLNEGVGVAASRTMEVIDTLGMLEIYAETDVELVNAAPDPMALRMQEASAFIEGMGQQLVDTVFYGDTVVKPETFTGLAPRLASQSMKNVLSSGATATDGAYTTSVYLVQWSPMTCHMIYPRGSMSIGLRHTDLGEVTVYTSSALWGNDNNSMFQAYRDHFQLKAGLSVRDERSLARICNIETRTSNATETSHWLKDDQIIHLMNYMIQRGAGTVMYMNREVFVQFDITTKERHNVLYSPDMPYGIPQVMFRGIPVRMCDGIKIGEGYVPL